MNIINNRNLVDMGKVVISVTARILEVVHERKKALLLTFFI